MLREGGNAVDAAVGAVLASFACEPLLTALGAGGYMLVVPPGGEPVLLDFFVEASGRGADPAARAELLPISVSFGDAIQVFNIGAASVGAYGLPAGLAEASRRFGRMTLADLVGPAATLARHGVVLNEQQAYVVKILGDIVLSTPEAAELFAPGGRLAKAGDVVRQPELGDALERLGAEGPDPFYTGDIGAAIAEWVTAHGGTLTGADLAAYRVIDRSPVSTAYRGREVVTNPPPSAGGILIARALSLLDAEPGPPDNERVVEVMEITQGERTAEFLEGLDDPAFVSRFLSRAPGGDGGRSGSGGRSAGGDGGGDAGGPLGSTTHISVLDREGWACGVTCSNGSCSGVVVPGTGVHLNNMAGEQDLNPLGFHRHPPGRRMPSMMAPTVVMRDRRPELVLGSAGSNRIRSAILQTIIRVVDDGLRAGEAVRAPRIHFEDGVVYTEPGVAVDGIEGEGRGLARFRELNLFFGGVQAVERDAGGAFWGGGDPRRGGAAVVVEG